MYGWASGTICDVHCGTAVCPPTVLGLKEGSFYTNRAYLAAIEDHNWELEGVEHTYQSIGI